MKMLAVFALALAGAVPAAQAGNIVEVEGNDSLASAQDVSLAFTTDFDANITNQNRINVSTLFPHVSIAGTGDDTFDYYRFSVANDNSVGIFDIDFGMPDVDIEIAVFDAAGNPLAEDDDFFQPGTDGDEAIDDGFGSVHGYDSFIEFLFTTAGDYFVGVARFPSVSAFGGWDTNVTVEEVESCDEEGNCVGTGIFTETPNSVPVPTGTDYTLNIAISNGPTPVPLPAAAPLMLGALGLLLGRTRRRRS